MAADLAKTRVTSLTVQACGDAQLANFGSYASSERELLFDLNDFDESLQGSREWDLKRLATSFTKAAWHNELDHDACRMATARVVQSYCELMNDLAGKRTTDIWYARYADQIDSDCAHRVLRRAPRKRRLSVAGPGP